MTTFFGTIASALVENCAKGNACTCIYMIPADEINVDLLAKRAGMTSALKLVAPSSSLDPLYMKGEFKDNKDFLAKIEELVKTRSVEIDNIFTALNADIQALAKASFDGPVHTADELISGFKAEADAWAKNRATGADDASENASAKAGCSHTEGMAEPV